MQSTLTPELMKQTANQAMPNAMNNNNMGISDVLKNPELIKSSIEMLKNTDDNHPMKQMLREKVGNNLDIDKLIRLAGYVQKVASGFVKTKQAVCSRTGKLLITLSFFFFVAYMTGFF